MSMFLSLQTRFKIFCSSGSLKTSFSTFVDRLYWCTACADVTKSRGLSDDQVEATVGSVSVIQVNMDDGTCEYLIDNVLTTLSALVVVIVSRVIRLGGRTSYHVIIML